MFIFFRRRLDQLCWRKWLLLIIRYVKFCMCVWVWAHKITPSHIYIYVDIHAHTHTHTPVGYTVSLVYRWGLCTRRRSTKVRPGDILCGLRRSVRSSRQVCKMLFGALTTYLASPQYNRCRDQAHTLWAPHHSAIQEAVHKWACLLYGMPRCGLCCESFRGVFLEP